jgi:putative addiction module killer protein
MGRYDIFTTETFDAWVDNLRDTNVRTMIFKYVDRMADGNLGDVRYVGDGVIERKIDVGPGYRLYFTQIENTVLLLLCGGDKSTQQRDITRAKKLRLEITQ